MRVVAMQSLSVCITLLLWWNFPMGVVASGETANPKNYCLSHPDTCKNEGTCRSTLGETTFTCSCKNGYYGKTCSEDYCQSHSGTCKNGGICKSAFHRNYFTCTCTRGYSGTTCTVKTIEFAGFTFEVFNDKSGTFEEAETFCDQRGGWMIEPKYEGLNSAIASILDSGFESFIGLKYYGESDAGWRWRNGEKLTDEHKKWKTGEGKKLDEHCAIMRNDRLWYDVKCGTRPNVRFACQSQKGASNSIKHNGYLLKTIDLQVNFTEAENICKMRGGMLAEPKTFDMNNKLISILTSNKCYFIDLKYDSGWKWRNGDVAAYSNWNTNPNSQDEKCAKICSSDKKWAVTACTSNRHCACQIDLVCNASSNPCQNEGICVHTNSTPYYQCNCKKGYYGSHCTEYLRVSSQRMVIGVVGDKSISFFVQVVTTEGNVRLEMHKHKHYGNPLQTRAKVGNQTKKFNFTEITRAIDGPYRVDARAPSEKYKVSVYVNISVHEKANITEISPKSIFSPPTTGPKSIFCNSSGFPTPSASWFRNGLRVKTGPKTTEVYQVLAYNKAILNVQHARLSDQGAFMCIATNNVSSGKVEASSNATAYLTVYGPPAITSVLPAACDVNGSVKTDWLPNNQTTGIAHRIVVRSVNSSHRHRENITTTNHNTFFNTLLPSTLYEIEVTVCPDDCISQLNATTTVTTGVGLPGKVNSFLLKNNNDSAICSITWNWPEKNKKDQISYFEVIWKSEMIYKSPIALENLELSVHNVSYPVLHHNVTVKPNRNYSVVIRAFSCAGPGPTAKATGDCVTEPENPPLVPVSNVSVNNGGGVTRKIDLTLPDEGNGYVSCMFLIVRLRNDSKPGNFSDTEMLIRASDAAQNAPETYSEDYVALAIQRGDFRNGKFNAVLGDNSITACDLSMAQPLLHRSKGNGADGSIGGRNWPLRTDGVTYRYFTVTSTPTSDGKILLKASEVSSFVNGSPPMYALYILLPTAFILIAIAGSAWHYRERRFASKDISSEIEGQNAYENVVLREMTSKTAIAVDKLHIIYRAMKADDGSQFWTEFLEVKERAKEVMLPANVASCDDMMTKNRYKNILPYDETRVLLEGEGLEGYINACHIKNNAGHFIATQGPLPNTIVDFWRMVIEQKIKIIVMLTRCNEAGKRKCEKYWPNAGKVLLSGSIEVTNVEEKFFGGFVKRSMRISNNENEDITVHQFQFLDWPDHGVPVTTTSFFRLHKSLMQSTKEMEEDCPLLVHCSAGVGRTGTFIGYLVMLKEMKEKKEMDFFNCVIEMRKRRVEMVQTSSQYEILHKLLVETLLFGETEITSAELVEKELQNANSSDCEKIEYQFKNLQVAESLNGDKGTKDKANEQSDQARVIIVCQPEDTEWISMDASNVESYDPGLSMIAAHAPLNSTAEYFWRAVLDNHVSVIVMLNKLDEEPEGSPNRCVQYWPQSPANPLQFNNVTVQILEEKDSNGIWERKLLVSLKGQQQKKVTQYQYMGWPNNGIPDNLTQVLELINKIQNRKSEKKRKSLLIHCSDGLGRTGVVCAIINIISRMIQEKHVDVFRAVKDLRDYRPGMVTNLVEYKLCYRMAKAYLENQNPYTEVSLQEDDPAAIYQND